jgi:chloramphenicol-sensitive protein RarD
LVRKKLNVRPLIGLFWETLIFLTPALIYLIYFAPAIQQEQNTYQLKALLVLAGLVTVLPLVGFNYATKRLPLSIIGFLQYLGPTISFIIAVNYYGEVFSTGHKIAFAGIWIALIIVSWLPFMKLVKNSKKI